MLEVIILGAGKGTRMRSTLPKVLHPLAGQPLLAHVIKTARSLLPSAIHVVIGHGADAVRAAVKQDDVQFHIQAEQLGTGHAVAQALPHCDPTSQVLVLFGDVPLISADVLSHFLNETTMGCGLLAAELPDPQGYGRILRDDNANFKAVIEEKDCADNQRSIKEVNTGVISAPAAQLLDWLSRVTTDNAQGEFYLPDALGVALVEGTQVRVVVTDDSLSTMGVNNRLQLEQLERLYQQRLAEQLLLEGVAISDRSRFDVRGTLTCGEGVVIDVNAVFEGDVVLEDNVRIGPNCFIRNAEIQPNSTIHAFTHVEDTNIGANCSIGPYARLRPGTQLADGVKIGNFVETKNAVFAFGSKANHLAYIGDAQIGSASNVGAGTITCNYDGARKHPTVIGDGVFVGSNSTLVAPVVIADRGFVAAGSVVTHDVDTAQLAVGRARQRNIDGWSAPSGGDSRKNTPKLES